MLRRAQIASDRYGRIVAYAYTERDGDELFVQGELIAAGFARVGDQVGSRACAAALLARETAARKAKLGLWADPYYDLIDAETPADVLAHKGQFALVEGRVVSVRESGRHDLREFRTALVRGFCGYGPETKRAQFRGRAGLICRASRGAA